MATATLCQAEELLRLCARDGCAMFAMEEDLFDASAMPAKEAPQFKLDPSSDKQPRQLESGSHSDNEDDDLLWCPSPTFPAARAADPPIELRPVATKPELSSSSNSNSSVCTFEAGVNAPGIARASQPTPPIPVPPSTSMEPKRSESVHQGNLFDPQAAQQQELQCSAPPTARAGAPALHQFDDGSGSKVVASSAPAGLTSGFPVHLQEASHLEGGGRISPDLNPAHQQQQSQQHQHQQMQVHELTCHTQQLQFQQPQPQQHQHQQQAAPASAAPATATSVMQHTRHTKRTPIPSVRLQRIMEGDAHASGSVAGARARSQHAAPRRRASGSSKRSAEHELAHGEHGAAQTSAHESRRAKAPRVGYVSGSSASASVSATPEPALVPGASLSAEPSLAPSAFAWPDEGAPLLPDEGAAWGDGASFGPAFARSGSSSSAVVIPSGLSNEGGLLEEGLPAFEAGVSASTPAGYGAHSLAGGTVHGSSQAMWAAAGEDGLLPHDMHVTTDLLDVAAELAAAADKEGSGHGMRGSAALPTLLTAPHMHPGTTHRAQPSAHATTHARLQSLGTQRVRAAGTGTGVPTQPRSKSRSGGAPRSRAGPPPLPRPDYDQHEDSEDGLPQVPPPRHPAGQPRGVPRAPARVLVPHPKGGCCTACKVAATPVWRTGPHGPKTLCNACGVRYTKAVTRKK